MHPVAILSYHKIGDPPVTGWDSWYYVTQARFREHLLTLHALGWEPIRHTALVEALDHPDRLGRPSVLVTFDDAYQSLVREALPVLEELGFPSVVFVPTAYVGGTNAFDADNEPEEPICTWDDLEELAARGMSVQSHGVRHAAMSDLDEPARRAELERSRRVLEQRLHEPVDLFAFPYGDAGDDPIAMGNAVRDSGYRAACGYGGGPADLGRDDRYCLPRLAMGPDTDLAALLAGSG